MSRLRIFHDTNGSEPVKVTSKHDEIAAELNIAKATVGTRLLRARQKLRDHLQRELDTP